MFHDRYTVPVHILEIHFNENLRKIEVICQSVSSHVSRPCPFRRHGRKSGSRPWDRVRRTGVETSFFGRMCRHYRMPLSVKGFMYQSLCDVIDCPQVISRNQIV